MITFFVFFYKKCYNIFQFQRENLWKKYLKKELIHSKNILDNINGYKLDYNQRLSIVCDEENTLVIAGAGSGKTLTIVGKIRYLIERKNISPKDILCISFTNNITKEKVLFINIFYYFYRKPS